MLRRYFALSIVSADPFPPYGAGELTNVKYGQPSDGQGGFGTPAREVSYDLDNVGNRDGMAGVNENGSMTGYYANELNEYTTVGGASTSAQTIQYSSHHELTKYQRTNYRYLADEQLSQIFLDAERSRAGVSYKLGYDALGRCVRRATDEQPIYYIYDGARVIAEFNPSTSVMTARNIYGNGIDEIVMRDLGTLTFPFQDRLGSTSALLETYGRVVEQYRYDAYGTPEFRSGPSDTDPNGTLRPHGTMNNNRYLFTGREWMQRYRIYEYRARAYHPGLGRFLQEDPMSFAAGDTNLFRYCGGDPVNYNDPSGLGDTKFLGYQNEGIGFGQGISAQGFWENADGTMTGTLGGSGPDTGNQGGGEGRGGGGGGIITGYDNPDSVTVRGWYYETPSFSSLDSLGFRPGEIMSGFGIRTGVVGWTPVLPDIMEYNGAGVDGGTSFTVRQTSYSRTEGGADKNTIAGRTSTGTSLFWAGDGRAIPGVAAVDPHLIPYGSTIITADGRVFVAADTGGDVVHQKASGGLTPVIDFFSANQVGFEWDRVIVVPYSGTTPYLGLSPSAKRAFFSGR